MKYVFQWVLFYLQTFIELFTAEQKEKKQELKNNKNEIL